MTKGKSGDKQHKQAESMVKPASQVRGAAMPASGAVGPPGLPIGPIRGNWPALLTVAVLYAAWLAFVLVLALQS